jgi:Helix-turn-helix domain
MLALALIEKIERLLQEGELSQRKIAELVGVSRGTVAAVATGRRGINGREPGESCRDPRVHLAPPERCPECGFLVYMPCLVCRTREHRHWQKVWQASGPAAAPTSSESGRRTKVTRRRRLRRNPSRSRVA